MADARVGAGRRSPGAAGGVGSSYIGYYRLAGRKLEGQFVVTAAERPTLHQAAGTTRGGWARWTTMIEPRDDGAASDVRVSLEYELPGEIVGSLFGMLTGQPPRAGVQEDVREPQAAGRVGASRRRTRRDHRPLGAGALRRADRAAPAPRRDVDRDPRPDARRARRRRGERQVDVRGALVRPVGGALVRRVPRDPQRRRRPISGRRRRRSRSSTARSRSGSRQAARSSSTRRTWSRPRAVSWSPGRRFAGAPAVAIVFALPRDVVLARNAARPGRVVDPAIVERHLRPPRGRRSRSPLGRGLRRRRVCPQARRPRPTRSRWRRGARLAGRRLTDPDQDDRHDRGRDPDEVHPRHPLVEDRDREDHRRRPGRATTGSPRSRGAPACAASRNRPLPVMSSTATPTAAGTTGPRHPPRSAADDDHGDEQRRWPTP